MLLVASFVLLRVDSVLVSVGPLGRPCLVWPGRASVRNADLEAAKRLFIAKECYGHVNMRARTIVDARKGSRKFFLVCLTYR